MTNKERKDLKNRKKLIRKSSSRGRKVSKRIKRIGIGVGIVLIGCIGFFGIKWVSVRVDWKNGLWGISESLNDTEGQIVIEELYVEEETTEEHLSGIEDLLSEQEAEKMIIRMNNLNRYNFSDLTDKINEISKLYINNYWVTYSNQQDKEEDITEVENDSENIEENLENIEDDAETYETIQYADTLYTSNTKIELIQNNEKIYTILDKSILQDSWSSIIPDKGCVIIIARTKDNKSTEFKESIRNYLSNLAEANEDNELYYVYNEYKEIVYNNYNIICACDNSEEVTNTIIDYMVDLDNKSVEQFN